MKRSVLWAAVLAAVLAIGAAVYYFGRGEDEIDVGVEPPAEPRTQLSATRVIGRHQGERQFEMDAAAIADEDDWIRIDAIENGVLYRDGRVFVTFDADGGRWHRPTNNLVLTGNVVLVYDDRVHIRTERLEWHAADEVVTAPGPVQMVIDGDTVEAAAMEAHLEEERVRLMGDVRIVRASGDVLEMSDVVYWLADERLEGRGRGRLVVGGGSRTQ